MIRPVHVCLPQILAARTRALRGTPSISSIQVLFTNTRQSKTSAPALVRCSMVLRMVKPDETTSSITTTLLPSTPAKTSYKCPPSSSLILRATLSSRSIPEAMHVANGMPLMEIPTIESTSSSISSSIMSANISETASILSPLTAMDLHPTLISAG